MGVEKTFTSLSSCDATRWQRDFYAHQTIHRSTFRFQWDGQSLAPGHYGAWAGPNILHQPPNAFSLQTGQRIGSAIVLHPRQWSGERRRLLVVMRHMEKANSSIWTSLIYRRKKEEHDPEKRGVTLCKGNCCLTTTKEKIHVLHLQESLYYFFSFSFFNIDELSTNNSLPSLLWQDTIEK